MMWDLTGFPSWICSLKAGANAYEPISKGSLMEDVVAAPSLFEACVAGSVRPRSVSDVKAIRAEQKPIKQFKHLFVASSFTLRAPQS